MARRRHWLLITMLVPLAALLAWASRGLWSAPSKARSASTDQQAPAEPRSAAALPQVSTLREQPSSAYHARLFADEDAVVLVTQTGFTTFRADAAPEEHAVDLGPIAVRDGDALIFWRSDRLRAIALSGGDERDLLPLPMAPQHLLASKGQVAWIRTAPHGRTSVHTLSDGRERTVYALEDSACAAAALRDGVVYWVAQSRDGAWQIRRVDLDGQHPAATGTHPGRPPAMLALGQDGIYFYAGPQRGVLELSFDLKRETPVLAQAICSPLAVSDRVVCAHVGGLFDIPPSSSEPRFLAREASGPVTAVAATHERAFWVAERGAEALIVRSVALAAR